MEDEEYKVWWPLHMRFVKGDALTDAEMEIYVAGRQRLLDDENLDGGIEVLRKLRSEIETREEERARRMNHLRRLRRRAAALEARLSPEDKRALGIRG